MKINVISITICELITRLVEDFRYSGRHSGALFYVSKLHWEFLCRCLAILKIRKPCM